MSSNLSTFALETLKKGFHVQVLFINKISGGLEPKATISSKQLSQKKPLEQVTLEDFQTGFGDKLDAKWTLCLENSAVVDQSNTLIYYLTLNEANAAKIQSSASKVNGDKAEPTAPPVLSAYVCVEKAMAPVPRSALGWGASWAEANKADTAISDRSASQLTAPALSTSHQANYLDASGQWADSGGDDTIPTAPGMLDCVVDFAKNDWNKIMMLNKLLYGFDVRATQFEIINARLPAFELCYSSKEADTYLQPFVEIHDTPHIDIIEVTTEFQSALANTAFSSKALEAMVSGGTPLISASVSAGMRSEALSGKASADSQKKKEYHATYKFPRVKLFLDENTLQITLDCKNDLKSLQDTINIKADSREAALQNLEYLKRFQRKYGMIFAQEVLLGGRLESTRAAESAATSSDANEKEALKTSLGVAVSYGPVAAAASTSSESQATRNVSSSSQRGNSAISFTARGGNTLLSADPAAWAATVAVWRNWRVIQQDEPVALQDLLGRFKEFSWVPALFKTVLDRDPDKPVAVAPHIPKFDSSQEWKKETRIRLWATPNIPEWTVSVRDASPQNEAAGPLSYLHGDYPLFLFKDIVDDFPGRTADTLLVDKSNGDLKEQQQGRGQMRFSLRKSKSSGQWQPNSSINIQNGDQVTLWCHSLGTGSWNDLNKPPTAATQAMWNSTDSKIRFNIGNQPLDKSITTEFILQYVNKERG